MKIIKCNIYHRLGNVIQALIQIAENLIIVLTLGFVYYNWSIKWIMYRLNNNKLYQRKNES